MMVTKWYTIQFTDVGKGFLKIRDRLISITGFMGIVLLRDIGKRIYSPESKVPQVENDEQFRKRMRK